MRAKVNQRPAKILHFDLENRPLSYIGQDYTTAEITVIAAGWAEQKKVHTWLLGVHEPTDMLEGFLELYNAADLVTGHYIRSHDLPLLNSALMEYGMPPLTRKWTSDTYHDLVKRRYFSAGQENLAATFGVKSSKFSMNTVKWRTANRLQTDGIALAKKRAVDDIIQHRELRKRMIEAGVLKRNKLWVP